MLGEGVRAAFEFLGIEHRTVCYVEREAAAAAQLARLMEAGALDSAPVWSDLLTFDGAAWRGCVDFLVAGFPCQDISIAGRRAGLDGQRSGLFFDILDIADDCGAHGLFLENVSAIATATATAVDEAEGTLEERAAARVVGELADRGWDAEWITLSASDVGASHGRARWFCLAWRQSLGNARLQHQFLQQWADGPKPEAAVVELANPSRQHGGLRVGQRSSGQQGRSDVAVSGGAMAYAHGFPGQRREGSSFLECQEGADERADGKRQWHGHAPDPSSTAMANARRMQSVEGPIQDRPHQAVPTRHEGHHRHCSGSGELAQHLADAGQQGLPHAEQPELAGAWPGLEGRAAAELRGAPLFAPGPLDPRWAAVVAHRPDLAPAVEPGVRMLADGMAYLVDESRAHQLRQVGNGVVPLQAAVALVELVRRAGWGLTA